ncbi:MAG TPA: SprT family zinc-dependent metalloprotease [Candidatus Sulfotelmatobacter sp.]|jgi:predicted metal-dependent hydrolase|nr:SprT family zinc-dependent metalloprotease [Candidatus Sulfotelmatobacter sp.]
MDNVTIVRSIKRKSVGIQVLSDASIKVTIPYFYPKWHVTKILQEKFEWITTAQQRMLLRQVKPQQQGYYLYLGKTYKLELHPGQKELVKVTDKIYIASTNDKFIKTYLTSWYKQQARKIIVERVNNYARIAGLSFRSVAITTAETRWGSCSSNRTLNFNWKLVMAPIEVIDYVITHELAHLTELNHSRAFWETIRKMYPLYREYRTWLKRNGHILTV